MNVLSAPKDIGSADALQPKDEVLLDLIDRKLQEGERVIVYTAWVRLDTQERLHKLLTEKGVKAAILDQKVPTVQREEWVDKRVREGVKVLITNSALVETGLDLNAFTTLVFYNIAFNLYVFRQASRRSWRINQTAPKVEIYMLYYADTMQHKALRLMASKLGFLELFDLLRIEDMDFPLETAKAAIFPESVNQAVSVDGGGLQANYHITELHGAQRRHDLL